MLAKKAQSSKSKQAVAYADCVLHMHKRMLNNWLDCGARSA